MGGGKGIGGTAHLAGGNVALREQGLVERHEPKLSGGRTSAVVVPPPGSFRHLLTKVLG